MSTAQTRRVAFYSHGTQGLGHIRRNIDLAAALVAAEPDTDVLLITGNPEAAALPLPPRIDVATLPTIRKDDDGRYATRAMGSSLELVLDVRASIIDAALAAFEPDLLVVDKVPLGVRGELEPALQGCHPRRARSARGARHRRRSHRRVGPRPHHGGRGRLFRRGVGLRRRLGLRPRAGVPLPRSVAEKVVHTGYLGHGRGIGTATRGQVRTAGPSTDPYVLRAPVLLRVHRPAVAWSTAQALAALAGGPPVLPRLVATAHRLGLVAVQHLPGTPLDDLLMTSPEPEDLAARAGETLAVLHGHPAPTLRHRRPERAGAAVSAAAEALGRLLPKLRDRARTVAAASGDTLHDLLRTDRALDACRRVGTALALLHAVPVPAGVRLHGGPDEHVVLERSLSLARAHGVDGPDLPLPELPGTGPVVLVHRDLHDKQVLVADDGAVGVLAFDLLAAGDPALDLGNLLVHLDLRAAQGLAADAAPLRRAVLDGYAPSADVLERLPAWEQATRTRLAAVYAFRPRWSAVAASLSGQP